MTRTMLQDKHRPAFEALSEPQLARLVSRLSDGGVVQDPGITAVSNGIELFTVCREAGLDQAAVVLSLGREIDLVGRKAIETLIGREITDLDWRKQQRHWGAPGSATMSAPMRMPSSREPARRVVVDVKHGMVVVAVKPNPKKVGSSSHDRYAKWAVGLTVSECIAAGLTMADVKWDTERGFVTIADPSTEEAKSAVAQLKGS